MKRKLMDMAYNGDPLLGETALSSLHVKIIKHVAYTPGGTTSSDIARSFNRSMRRSSSILKTLHDKGYLIRKPDSKSGNGVIYRYWVDQSEWGK